MVFWTLQHPHRTLKAWWWKDAGRVVLRSIGQRLTLPTGHYVAPIQRSHLLRDIQTSAPATPLARSAAGIPPALHRLAKNGNHHETWQRRRSDPTALLVATSMQAICRTDVNKNVLFFQSKLGGRIELSLELGDSSSSGARTGTSALGQQPGRSSGYRLIPLLGVYHSLIRPSGRAVIHRFFVSRLVAIGNLFSTTVADYRVK